MSAMDSRRRPWIAAALSLVCIGLGHVYCGRFARGVKLLIPSLLVAPVVVLLALLPPSSAAFVAFAALCTVPLFVSVFAVVDAWRIARRLGDDFVPRRYQRPAVYAAFAVAGFVVPFAAALVVRTYVFEAYKIPTPSMSPTLLPGDKVLANKLRVGMNGVHRGDVVVYRAHDVEGRPCAYVKRLIGLPGDRVEVREGRIFVNGEALSVDTNGAAPGTARERAGARSYRVVVGDVPGKDAPEVRLGQDQYYMLGDDRPRSMDSRTTGPVERSDLIGTVDYLFAPAESWSRAGALDDDE